MFTVTVNEQVAVLPDVSVAVQVTVVVPAGKLDPEGGVQITVATVQLSEDPGAGKVTTLLVVSGSPVVVWFRGQVIDGGWVSFTVTVN